MASDLDQYTVREGAVLSMSIGNLEMLGYLCVIAATVSLGVYEYRNWWHWRGEWKATRLQRFRDFRLHHPNGSSSASASR
ncbi:MAG: hypothetical protein ACYC5A_02400 [Thermoleophilia bacterium]